MTGTLGGCSGRGWSWCDINGNYDIGDTAIHGAAYVGGKRMFQFLVNGDPKWTTEERVWADRWAISAES